MGRESAEDRAGSGTPHGGVRTFLFADIRGYTSFTHSRGDAAAATLTETFARIVQEVAEPAGGYGLQLRGDEALIVFDSPRAALRTALKLQDALRAAENTTLPLRVGMGVDSGEAVPVLEGHRGGALNLAARLCSLAAPGEIFTTPTVTTLAGKIPGVEYVDRGEATVKGFPDPVRLLEVVWEGTAPRAGSLRRVTAESAELPPDVTPFLGRAREVSEVVTLLMRPDIRLLTLSGPGGVGKTRLATEAARRVAEHLPDGVFFVSLASLTDPGILTATISEALGLREIPGENLDERLQRHLRDKELLLLLDGFEHLVDAASTVSRLLATCAHLQVLATSRAVLQLKAEHEYRVPPLGLPDLSNLPGPAALLSYDAVNLFVDRARAARPGFSITDETAGDIAEICQRLDGLPLALELAAARIRVLPPHALLKRLSNRLELLSHGARDAPLRQRTLRAAIEWSFELLEPDQRLLMARMSVFAGGGTLQQIGAIVNHDGRLSVDPIDELTGLVERSLLTQVGAYEPRFTMLETVREYAGEALRTMGEDKIVCRLHAEHFVDLADNLKRSATMGRPSVVKETESELGNMRAAFEWSLQHDSELALRLVGSLAPLWAESGHLAESRRWADRALGLGRQGDPRVLARALSAACLVANYQTDAAASTAYGEESMAVARQTQDDMLIAAVSSIISVDALSRGKNTLAQQLAEEGLKHAARSGDSKQAADLMTVSGMVAVAAGDVERARTILEAVVQNELSQSGQASLGSLYQLIGLALYQEDIAAAERLVDEKLPGGWDEWMSAKAFHAVEMVGRVRAAQGRGDHARALFLKSMAFFAETDMKGCLVHSMEAAARLALIDRKAEWAVRLLGAADAILSTRDNALNPVELALYHQTRQKAEAALSGRDFSGAWSEGRAMTISEAIAGLKRETGRDRGRA